MEAGDRSRVFTQFSRWARHLCSGTCRSQYGIEVPLLNGGTPPRAQRAAGGSFSGVRGGAGVRPVLKAGGTGVN